MTRMIVNRLIHTVSFVLLVASAPLRSQSPAGAVQGLDHVPVAVNDLDAAAERYRQLGFTLKPGRPHGNGLANWHAKFEDATEIELITAPKAADALTTTYRQHLAAGDGPAFLALFAPAEPELTRALARADLPFTRTSGLVVMAPPSLQYLFFGRRNAAPDDLPAHLVHRNTAQSFSSVWLAGDDLSMERRLLASLGATMSTQEVEAPERTVATVARFARGTVMLLPGRHQIVPGRRIVGLSLTVRDIAAARASVGRRADRSGPSQSGRVIVPPNEALGYWLEFRQARPAGN